MGAWAGAEDFADVLAAARAGDERAFATLWRWLQPRLLRWLHVVAPDNVEDVASEVWMSVARSLPSFEGGEDEFRGWVFTLARRRAVDWGRRRRRQPTIATVDGMELADLATGLTPTEDTDTLDTVLTLLQGLTAAQAEVIALRVIGDLSVRETALVVNKSEGAVRVLCHRGLRLLAQRLDAAAPAQELAR